MQRKRNKHLSYCSDGMSLGIHQSSTIMGGSAFCSWFVVALFTRPTDIVKKGLSLLKCNNNTKSKLLQLSIARQQKGYVLGKLTRHCMKEDGLKPNTSCAKEWVGREESRKDACTFSSQPCAMKGRLHEPSKRSKCWKNTDQIRLYNRHLA